jgi:hypothetical protein
LLKLIFIPETFLNIFIPVGLLLKFVKNSLVIPVSEQDYFCKFFNGRAIFIQFRFESVIFLKNNRFFYRRAGLEPVTARGGRVPSPTHAHMARPATRRPPIAANPQPPLYHRYPRAAACHAMPPLAPSSACVDRDLIAPARDADCRPETWPYLCWSTRH